jgi:hypothetical protein
VKQRVLVAAVALLTAGIVAADAQDVLKEARDLYASAAYEEALTALTELHKTSAPTAPLDQIDQYRAFCLFALGRSGEAATIAESLIKKNPLVELDPQDASPRIAAMFDDVRKRVLPGLIREHYRSARSTMDRKEFAEAVPQLVRVGEMIDQAQKLGASDETIADLRVLVDGFLELARAAAEPRKAETSSKAEPILPERAAEDASAPATDAGAPAAAGPTIYDAQSAGIAVPTVVRQDFPPIPQLLDATMPKSSKSGVLEVIIDERGDVEQARIRESLHPIYDTIVTTAARHWKYRPAIKSGTPVKFRKSIGFGVKENTAPGEP